MKTILMTGATGFIGQHLLHFLKAKGNAIRTLTTQSGKQKESDCYYWNPAKGIIDEQALTGVDIIVHLAGASIGTDRWTPERKQVLRDSRIVSTQLLFERVVELGIPLEAFITASATGIYGSFTTDHIFSEVDPPADDFLGKLCQDWESAADAFADVGIRTVKIRTGVVLSHDAPAFKKMTLPIRLGVGSALGSGKQYMPWIHIYDLCRIYAKAIREDGFSGVCNAVAPQHISNEELMRTLARKLKRPFWFPAVPAWTLKLLFGEMSVILLEGSRVQPERLLENGFEFNFPTVDTIPGLGKTAPQSK